MMSREAATVGVEQLIERLKFERRYATADALESLIYYLNQDVKELEARVSRHQLDQRNFPIRET